MNLKWSYIQGKVIHYPITHTKHRRRIHSPNKLKRSKKIYLNSIALEVIRKQKGASEYVFDLPKRDANTMRKTIYRIRKITGIPDFTFHQLRHTVSTVISSQLSLAAAKSVLGHSDIKTTLRYTHIGAKDQVKGARKMKKFVEALQK